MSKPAMTVMFLCSITPQLHAAAGQLIVFVQPTASDVARHFEAEVLEDVQALAASLDVDCRVVDPGRGFPAEVAITPLIVFQNHLGRSVYQGRYSDIERLRTFVRTATRVPQAADENIRKDIPLWQSGRAHIATPLKITQLSGAPPEGFDPAAFERRARRAIATGFGRLKMADAIALARSDRMFYMDFYPWRSSDGRFAVAVNLFSQFNCKIPIFEQDGAVAAGTWDGRDAVFAKAAADLERAMLAQIASPARGDGFDVVPDPVERVAWDDVDLALPAKPAGGTQRTTVAPLARTWRVLDDDFDYLPVLQFRFAPPLDSYAGEILKVAGSMALAESLALSSVRGSFIADPRSATMGEALLDKTLQTEVFLDTTRFPDSSFTIDKASGGGVVAWGHVAALQVEGRFTLKGITVPLIMEATLEPIADSAGAPLLNFRGRFDLDIRPFKLEGPDGPSPATHTMRFDFDLFLIPTEQ